MRTRTRLQFPGFAAIPAQALCHSFLRRKVTRPTADKDLIDVGEDEDADDWIPIPTLEAIAMRHGSNRERQG
jgi:hypothetical protein